MALSLIGIIIASSLGLLGFGASDGEKVGCFSALLGGVLLLALAGASAIEWGLIEVR